MSAEARLANTSITQLDPTLTKDILYSRLVEILDKSQIDEIGLLPFLPVPEQCQGEAGEGDFVQYPFVVQERGTKLGIPIFCWVPVLDAAYGVFKEAVRCSSTVASGLSVDWWQDPERRKKVMKSSACLMIFCPDSFMAVNARKRLVQEGCLSAEDEIRFLDMVITFPRNCKSSGAWHHRKWLLCFLYKDHNAVPLDPLVVEEQLKICQEAAERYPKCYYAWTMRHWLVEHLGVHWWKASLARRGTPVAPAADGGGGVGDTEQQDDDYYLTPMEKEFERMKNHMQRNVSDHSGQQHLQQCMVQLSGQWIVQRKVLESMSNAEVALQWTRKELASRRQRRRIAGTSNRRMKQQVRKRNQEEEKKEMQGRARTGFRQSAIRSQVRDLSLFSMVSPTAAATDGSDGSNEKQGGKEQSSLALARASFPWVVRLWVSELERTRDMVRTYPGHESLWYHLRFMYYGVCWLDSESELLPGSGDVVGDSSDYIGDGGENVDVEEEQGGDVEEEGDEWFVTLASERAFVEGLLTEIGVGEEEAEEVPAESGLDKLQRLADKYLAWVKHLDLDHQLP